MDLPQLLWMLLAGYMLAVVVEVPILTVGLSWEHPLRRRILAGFWLTACTYPIVILVIPPLIFPLPSVVIYVFVAEIFAAAAECMLFWCAFDRTETVKNPHVTAASPSLTPLTAPVSATGDSASIQPPDGHASRSGLACIASRYVPFSRVLQDFSVIITANLASFVAGEYLSVAL